MAGFVPKPGIGKVVKASDYAVAEEDRVIFQPGKTPKHLVPAVEIDPQGGPVKAWSASALKKFQQCPYSVYLGRVKRIKEESGEAANRGTIIHDQAEQFVRGNLDFPDVLQKFKTPFDALERDFTKGMVTLEEDWGFDIDWSPTGFFDDDVWCRMKLDALVLEDESSARLIDYKSGKKFGNEGVHGKQAMIYSIGAFFKFPELQFIQTEFWYIDKGEFTKHNYTRASAMVMAPRLHAQGVAMTSCTDFEPRPSAYNCQWCFYGKEGHCEWAYQK